MYINSTLQSTNGFALEIAYFNHIQADCFKLLLYTFYLQKCNINDSYFTFLKWFDWNLIASGTLVTPKQIKARNTPNFQTSTFQLNFWIYIWADMSNDII